MRAVIQRVNHASVLIDKQVFAKINGGLLILLGIDKQDVEEDCVWLANKVSQLRIFADHKGKMNHSIIDVHGDVLVVSQFTLHAKIKKGTRPSYINAAIPEKALPLYEKFKEHLSLLISKKVFSGKFGSAMEVVSSNNGPVTIIIDTKNKQ